MSCKFGHYYSEVIGERWMGACPMFECLYEGDKEVADTCNEDKTCPAFEEKTEED